MHVLPYTYLVMFEWPYLRNFRGYFRLNNSDSYQILDYKHLEPFHKKAHNVAINPCVSKLSLMIGKLALLHLFCMKGFICWRNISISNTCALKGFFHCYYANSRNITWSVGILANALPFYIKPFYVSWLTCSDHSFYSWGSEHI